MTYKKNMKLILDFVYCPYWINSGQGGYIHNYVWKLKEVRVLSGHAVAFDTYTWVLSHECVLHLAGYIM